ncbi:MAG: EamA family transporter RarD [Myxococcota bacterium]|nr:EamA family transporter RarD [Myxococcota bacterium]
MKTRRGMVAGVAAYLVWGASPIFWKATAVIPAFEVLSWRVLSALALLLGLVALTGRGKSLRRTLSNGRTIALAVASGALLAVNWILFIWAVTEGHILEASLGYYINPLMSVALGVALLGEELRPAVRLAVGIAALGVAVMTIAGGQFPWIALSLAVTFAIYGLMKKHSDAAPPIEGLLTETATVTLPLGFYLITLLGSARSVAVDTPSTWALIPFTGVITIVPLVLFGYAAQRIPLSSVGMLQYIAPTLQLMIGVGLYGEVITTARAFGFASVWTALAIFAWDNLRSSPEAAAES